MPGAGGVEEGGGQCTRGEVLQHDEAGLEAGVDGAPPLRLHRRQELLLHGRRRPTSAPLAMAPLQPAPAAPAPVRHRLSRQAR